MSAPLSTWRNLPLAWRKRKRRTGRVACPHIIVIVSSGRDAADTFCDIPGSRLRCWPRPIGKQRRPSSQPPWQPPSPHRSWLCSPLTSLPDPWHGRSVTFESDWARFAEQDLDEATARIRRLAQVAAIRVRSLRAEWDAHASGEWTIREIAEHLAESTAVYANMPEPTRVASPAK